MTTLQYFDIDCISTIEELKTAYRELCKKCHPDHNPEIDDEPIKIINAEYVVLKQLFETNRFEGAKNQENEIDQIFIKMYFKICHLPLTIELVGNWIWVTGNTYAFKKQLLESGYTYLGGKKCWCLHPPEYKAFKSKKSLDEIKTKYGSVKFDPKKMGRKFLDK